MIKKINSLVGKIDCPYCFSLLQWDDIEDIKVSNGTKYVICPECEKNIILDNKKDYWVEPSSGSDEGGSSEGGTANLPAVTAADNGKVLIVKNGVWTVDGPVYEETNSNPDHV